MPAIPFADHLERFTATLERSGATVLVGGTRKPARIRVVSGDRTTDCVVYLWTITPGGGPPGVRPAGERRIQITNAGPFTLTAGLRTIVGGWNPEEQVWAFWDARRHTRFSTRSPSFQTTEQTLQLAGHNGIAAHVRPANEGREVTVAVHPDFLLWYVQDGQTLHDVDEDANEVSGLIEASPEEEAGVVAGASTPEQLARRVQLVEIMRAFRDARFRPLVLQAYGNRCAVCGTALKLVDAAHIVPVSDRRGTDDVTNGIALCRLHHGAYDTGLLGVQSNYRVVVNPDAASRLQAVRLDAGLEGFANALPNSIQVPSAIEVRPDPRNLRIGLEVRQFPRSLIA
jgi:putative restriction endonuclease